jgi:hypothetical protein
MVPLTLYSARPGPITPSRGLEHAAKANPAARAKSFTIVLTILLLSFKTARPGEYFI